MIRLKLKSGIDVWISGNNYTIGEQVISPADLYEYVRKTNGAGTADPSNDATNWKRHSSSGFKSIQRGYISVNYGNTAEISPVDIAKSEIYLLGNSSASGSGLVYLTNSTTVTAVGPDGSTTNTVGFQVKESW